MEPAASKVLPLKRVGREQLEKITEPERRHRQPKGTPMSQKRAEELEPRLRERYIERSQPVGPIKALCRDWSAPKFEPFLKEDWVGGLVY